MTAILQLITGRLPYNEIINEAKVMNTISAGVTPPRATYPELPESHAAWAIFESCWRLEPNERLTMNQVEQDVRTVLA